MICYSVCVIQCVCSCGLQWVFYNVCVCYIVCYSVCLLHYVLQCVCYRVCVCVRVTVCVCYTCSILKYTKDWNLYVIFPELC